MYFKLSKIIFRKLKIKKNTNRKKNFFAPTKSKITYTSVLTNVKYFIIRMLRFTDFFIWYFIEEK